MVLCMLMILTLFTIHVPHAKGPIYKLPLACAIDTEQNTSNTKGTIYDFTIYHPGILLQPAHLEAVVAPSKI